ncbi:MAG: cytochrome c biogenesis protein CcdA [Candidatus Margulisiibacteriota bacterium]
MIDLVKKAVVDTPFLAVFIIFWVGAVASLGFCTLARLPVVLGFVGGTSDNKRKAFLLTLNFAAGMVVSFCIIGLLFGMISTNVDRNLVLISKYIFRAMGFLLLTIGLFVSGLLKLSLPHHHHINERFKRLGFVGAFLFGMAFAVMELPGCPCCSSMVLVLASLSLIKANVWYSALIFVSFALGQSLPGDY